MSQLEEQLTEQFYQWEHRGRGWQVFGEPVYPEPPFRPFDGHYLPATPPVDEGARPTFLSSLVEKLSNKLNPAPPPEPVEPEEEPEPTPLIRGSLVEFQASLPDKLNISKEEFEQFLLNLSLCREPIAFELLGVHKKVTAQFAAGAGDAPLLRRQLSAYFPEAVFVPREGALEQAWDASTGDEALAAEFGLAHEFMLPLASGKIDPFIGIIGALSELQLGELGLFQVIWQPVRNRWAESILASVTHSDGKPYFVNSPELANAAENKIDQPLFAAVVRVLIRTGDFDRLLQLASDITGSLRVFTQPNGNELIPLKNDDYPFEEHIEDVLLRQTRRTGMILNSDELIGFAHLPSSAVRSPVFQRQTTKTKAAPGIVQQHGLLLGNNDHAGKTVEVRLSAEQRTRHCHIIGASGTGKSTLLFNLIRQDIENGEGIAVLDPHGDLIDRILGVIPQSRIQDVVLVDPSDEQYSVGFNILSAHSDLEKTLLASDLVAVFERLSTSWGDQMNSVLQNAILAFLESDRRGTLADLRSFLIEPAFRNEFLKSVKDSEVVYYWQKSFSHLSGNKSIGSILTRLDTFLAKKPIRYMVSQPENRLDFAQIMDSGKIFLAKLPEGLLGKENSYLLGTLMVSKFQQMAMSRQAQQIAARRDFWIYIDEFANFITPSMAEILSGARKYRIGLTLAHHELHQLQRAPEVASAVMSHPFTRVVFHVGDDDAKRLAEGFSYFEAKDLRNLDVGQAIARVERSDFDFNLTVPLPVEPDKDEAATRRQEVITVFQARETQTSSKLPRFHERPSLQDLSSFSLQIHRFDSIGYHSHVISHAGGAAAMCLTETISRAPCFVFKSTFDACSFLEFAMQESATFQERISKTSGHCKFMELRSALAGRNLFLGFDYQTGDASGQNMVTIATDALCRFLVEKAPVKPVQWYIEGNMSGDKKATMLSFLSARGKKVIAEVVIPAALLKKIIHVTPLQMIQYGHAAMLGGTQSGSIGVQGHYANALAAMFIACGQDAACVSEASTGLTDMDITEQGDLYASVTLPNVIVGTVGGGTHLPTAQECLAMLGCVGEGTARKFAEICTATVLAGEISIMGALASGEFVSAHAKYARQKKKS